MTIVVAAASPFSERRREPPFVGKWIEAGLDQSARIKKEFQMSLRRASIFAGLTLAFAGTAHASFLYSFSDSSLFDFKFTTASLLNVTTTIGTADLFDVVNHTNPAGNLSLSSVQMTNPYSAAPSITLFFTGGQLSSHTMNDWPGPFDHVGTYTYFTGARLTISESVAVPEPPALTLVLTALGGLWLVTFARSHASAFVGRRRGSSVSASR